MSKTQPPSQSSSFSPAASTMTSRLRATPKHREYIEAMEENDLVIAVGPAGTGKTYTAIQTACKALMAKNVGRIVLTRPAIAAGESLGFIPGEVEDKLAPYMRPLYDALSDNLTMQKVRALMAEGTIEIAPIGFMRGRTICNAFMIVDEAQNCTYMQLKMLMTRLGPNTTMVINGDPGQSDLEQGQSGLEEVVRRLHPFSSVPIVEFNDKDVMRHPLVREILPALEAPYPTPVSLVASRSAGASHAPVVG